MLLLSVRMMNKSFNVIGKKYVWVQTLGMIMSLFFDINDWGILIMQL
jgi:hypothetical protein